MVFIQCYYAGYIQICPKECLCEWVSLNGMVQKGTKTKFDCLLFITQINDLQSVVPTVKLVDDSTA